LWGTSVRISEINKNENYIYHQIRNIVKQSQSAIN